MRFTYSIIDHSAVSVLQLRQILQDYGNYDFLSCAKDTENGINNILKEHPDILFLNLKQDAEEKFNMVSDLYRCLDKMPTLIAISDNKNHAYDAFKHNFFDYWLFPFKQLEMSKSLARLKNNFPLTNDAQTICLKSYSDYQYLETNEILYLKADNNATDFVMLDGRKISAYKTLKTYENGLPTNFLRIHQSYIVNSRYVSRINYSKGICAFKTGRKQLPFSKSYKNNIEKLKSELTKQAILAPF